MAKTLDILIIEDEEQHLNDAHAACENFNNINFYFASTLEDAKAYLQHQRLDGVISDVFFPKNKGQPPTSESGLEIARYLIELGLTSAIIPFVLNTSTHHHGKEGSVFQSQYVNLIKEKIGDKFKGILNGAFGIEDSVVGIGRIFEGFPNHSQLELRNHKQWEGAIYYTILLARSNEITPERRWFIFKEVMYPWMDGLCVMSAVRPVLSGSWKQEEGYSKETRQAYEFIENTVRDYTKN